MPPMTLSLHDVPPDCAIENPSVDARPAGERTNQLDTPPATSSIPDSAAASASP